MRKVFLMVLVLAVAGCAGEDAEAPVEPVPSSVTVPETTAPPETAPETSVPDTTEAPATTAADEDGATIEINGLSFGGPVTISAGETVRVVNNDTLPHTWTSDDDLFNVSLSPSGGRGSFTFEEPGTYSFVCTIHPSMTGSVTVEG